MMKKLLYQLDNTCYALCSTLMLAGRESKGTPAASSEITIPLKTEEVKRMERTRKWQRQRLCTKATKN